MGDEFWKVALEYDDTKHRLFESSSEEDEYDAQQEQSTTYRLPCLSSCCPGCSSSAISSSSRLKKDSLTLLLSPLPLTKGVWSPLGADAWYASAVLAAMLLLDHASIHEKLLQSPVTCLELGSGAVSLPGMTLAWLMAQQKQRHQLILTDNEDEVLVQLNRNVQRASETMKQYFDDDTTFLPEIKVRPLDWKDDDLCSILNDNQPSPLPPLQLVIGSELVYTPENAMACATLITRILQDSPEAMIWIVQVPSRSGWENVFLPALEQRSITVQELVIDANVHELAETLIPHRGSLDRSDVRAVCITLRHAYTAHETE
jgi:hypothetical protein